ncbi:MAG: hypothetical protein IPH62_04190 [Ignavibacteriae bacterium]|nr:hypothetical protein [Ignavibacteriota bacterium]
MKNVDNNFVEIGSYLNLITKEVNTITNDNLDIKLKNVNSYIKQIDRKKREIKENSTEDYFKAVCDRIHTEVKHISTKFDSIVEEKKEIIKNISEELSKTVNKKKLINYQR